MPNTSIAQIEARKEQEDYLGPAEIAAFDFQNWALPKQGVVEIAEWDTAKGRMSMVYEPACGLFVARLANVEVGGSAYCHADELAVCLVSAGHVANQRRELGNRVTDTVHD